MRKEKNAKNVESDPTPLEEQGRDYRTGPNVDVGLEPGAVTVDPQTAAGQAAAAAREANGAKVTTDDRKVIVESVEDHSDDRVDDPLREAFKAENDPKVTPGA